MSEIVALGELLIDFTPCGRSQAQNPIFEKNPGGAPANVLAFLSKMGMDTAFIGKVGNDMFGEALKGVLDSVGIGTEGIVLSKDFNTTLAFVELDEHGDRSFSFVRRHGADKMLTPAEIDLNMLEHTRFFHFGGVTLTDEPARSATLFAAEKAKAGGAVVSYDPNYRPLLWDTDARAVLSRGLALADIVKVSDEECRLLSGLDSLEEGSALLMKQYGIRLMFVTLGPKGSACRFGDSYRQQQTFDVKTIDTTGAGDAFMGAMLYCLIKSEKTLKELTIDDIDRYMRFANAAGSLVTTRKGAILSMPTLDEINRLLH